MNRVLQYDCETCSGQLCWQTSFDIHQNVDFVIEKHKKLICYHQMFNKTFIIGLLINENNESKIDFFFHNSYFSLLNVM